jgi:hypothetical protein
MVGEGSRLAMKLFNLLELTEGMVGSNYDLGNMDCFSIIIMYLARQEVCLPTEFEGMTLATYAQAYKKDPVATREKMFACLDSVMTPVLAEHAKPGDVLLLKLRASSGVPFPAIDGGNANVIFADKQRGVMLTSVRPYRVLKGWKCQLYPQ